MLPSQSVRPLQLALSGNGLTPHGPASTEIHGRDVATGLARSVQVDTAAVRRRHPHPADRRPRRHRQGAARLPARPGGRPRGPRDHDGRRQRPAARASTRCCGTRPACRCTSRSGPTCAPSWGSAPCWRARSSRWSSTRWPPDGRRSGG